jgi:bacillithiol system protein YtxJ
MIWNYITEINQLDSIDKESETVSVVILKHSTTCSISSMALSRIERKWKEEDNNKIKFYYLDLLKFRNISNEIESRYKIEHQSPQVLLIKNKKCIFSQTHSAIRYEEVLELSAQPN